MGQLHLGPSPLHKALGCCRIACHSHAPSDAAGRLHQTGRCQIGRVHHDAWGKGHEARAPVRFAFDDGRDSETALAQAQHLPGFQVQVVEQRGVDPHFANGGNGGLNASGGWLAYIGHNKQLAPQRVTRLHRLEGDQAAGTALFGHGAGHGGKAHIGVGLQAQALGFLHKGGWRALVADHHGVATEQLSRIAPQARLHAIGQKTDRRERGHRQRHRHHEQPQLTRTQIAPQIARPQPQAVHPSLFVHIPTLPHMPFTAGSKAFWSTRSTIRPKGQPPPRTSCALPHPRTTLS